MLQFRKNFETSLKLTDISRNDAILIIGIKLSGRPIPFGYSSTASVSHSASNAVSDDDMTALINWQKSDGMFQITTDGWENSILKTYLGNIQDVRANCPANTTFNVWLTALAVKILELKMSEKKELWELVAEKSKKYILRELLKNEQEYRKLQERAEEYITTKNK